MADKYPKSKLKRKKTAVVDINQADGYQRDSLQTLNTAFSPPVPIKDAHSDSSKANRGTVSPTLTWWTRNDLNVSEKLWANTIESALPFLGSELWDPLPEPSTATPRPSKPQLHVPTNEVPPFPEPSRPPGSPLRSPSRPICVFSPAHPIDPPPPAGPAVTTARGGGVGPRVPESTAAGRSTSRAPSREVSLRPAPTREAVSVGQGAFAKKTPQSQEPAERPVRPFPLWSGTAPRPKGAPPGPPTQADTLTSSGVRGGRRVQVAEVEEERVEEAGPSGAQREEGGEVDGPEEVEPGAGAGGGGAGAGAGGGERLLCCPMCTLGFPSSFSQMDCDSHLAQCLSEMNVDMAW